jgi:ribosomal protein S18 acetylase RimI-like enzyme
VTPEISPLLDEEIDALVALWEKCGLTRPWNNPRADIDFARRSPNAAILVARLESRIAASAMVGHDGHRGWLYYVAADPALQGRGLGRAINEAAEDWLRSRGIAKVQLLVRGGNKAVTGFYEKLGYGEQERVLYAKWLDGRPLTP